MTLQVLKHGLEQLSGHAQSSMRDVLVRVLGRTGGGVLGGIRFDALDDMFDSQPALALLPRALTAPFDTLISFCTTGLSEGSKDTILAMLVDACCERLEHFISQVGEGVREPTAI